MVGRGGDGPPTARPYTRDGSLKHRTRAAESGRAGRQSGRSAPARGPAVSLAPARVPAVQPGTPGVSCAERHRPPRPTTDPRYGPTTMSATRGPRDPFPPHTVTARWRPAGPPPAADAEAIRTALADVRRPVVIVRMDAGPAVADGGSVAWGGEEGLPVLAVLPPLHPSALGDPAFRADHGLRYPYITGAMANGIGVGRDRRGDGPGRDARLLRGGRAVARPDRDGHRPAQADARRPAVRRST